MYTHTHQYRNVLDQGTKDIIALTSCTRVQYEADTQQGLEKEGRVNEEALWAEREAPPGPPGASGSPC